MRKSRKVQENDNKARLLDPGGSPPLDLGRAESAALAPDGRRALLVTGDEVSLWDLDDGKPLRQWAAHPPGAQAAAFFPDGTRAVTSGADHTVRVWDVATGAELRRASVAWGGESCLAVSPDGRRVLLGCGNYTAHLLDAEGLKEIGLVAGGPGVAFSPDGRFAALACLGQQVAHVIDVASGKPVYSWRFPGPVSDVAFAPDGRHLATANGNGTVYVFRLADGPPKP